MKRREFLEFTGAAAAAGLPLMSFPKDIAAGGKESAVCSAVVFEARLKHAWTLSRGTWNTRRNILVRITKDGRSGIGESAPIARYGESAESGLAFIDRARPVLEKDLWAFRDRWAEIDALAPGEHAAKAALDTAVLDWVARGLNVPLYRLLGLDPAKTPPTTCSIGIDEVKAMQAKVREAAAFGVLKIKLGTPDDRKIIEGLREVTDKPFRVDANEGWTTKEEALSMIEWLAGKGVEFVEQPMPAGLKDEAAWLKARSPLPVFADESLMSLADIPEIAAGFHGLNVKIMKCGGIQEAVRMASLARAMGLRTMLGCMIETSLGITAAASIAPLFDYADLDGNLLIGNDPFTGVRTVGDRLVLGDKPGLGVDGDVWQ